MNSLNSVINDNKASFDKLVNYRLNNFISFKGQLEDNYFKSAKTNDVQGQLSALKNLGFNISEIDYETGSNFLHFAIKSQNDSIISQALLLLSKKKSSPETISSIIKQEDSDGKTPCEYTKNETTIKRIERITGTKIQIDKTPSESAILKQDDDYAARKLNELPEGTKINIPTLDDDEDDIEFINQAAADNPSAIKSESFKPKEELPIIKLEEVAGHINAKEVLSDRIIEPLKDDRFVTDNGFLIHDTVGNGKTFLLNALSVSLDRKIFDDKLFDEAIDDLTEMTKDNKEKYKKGLADIFSKNIIQVSNLQDLEKVTDLARKSYRYSGKQAVIFIDEIKGILPDITAPSSQGVTKAEQLIENSAKKGFILVATTREMDAIKPESIRYGRFDKKIELRPPNEEERKELVSKYYKGNYQLSVKNIEDIAKLTSGFTYINFLEFLDNLQNDKITDYETLINELRKYAKEQNLGELTEKGTTACYDRPEFKREKVNTTFDDVAGMQKVKEKFQEELIDKLKPERLEWFKKHNRLPIRKGFLLYGTPGTGKTYIATALAGEMGLPLYKLDSASFKDKYIGESERKLKDIFNQLRNKFEETGEYSILFIDEANDILGKREDANKFDEGIVNMFLQYLNDAPKNGIIPIVATNFREKLDDAILSRLGIQIRVPLPDDELRLSLINYELDKISEYTKNISLEQRKYLSERLGGFSSRDITNILTGAIDNHSKHPNSSMTIEEFIDEASKFAKEHKLPEINAINKTSGYDTLIKRKNIKYPADFNDVAGMENVKHEFQTLLIDRLKPEIIERLKKDGNNSPLQSNFLLYGPAGTGKTFIAEAIAGEMKIPIYEIDSSIIKDKFVGESEKQITNIFNQLEEKFEETGEYSILFIDEANDILGKRENASNYESGLVDLFLQKIHNSAQRGIITIIATNFRDKIDDAVLSRLGKQIEITPPDEKLRKALVLSQFSKRPSTRNITEGEVDEIVKMLSGFSSRDITYALQEIIDNHVVYHTTPLEFKDFAVGVENYAKQHKINVIKEN